MYLFLIPLVLGFAFNAASALTSAFSRRWGEKRGSLATAVLRNVLGIPVWAMGFIMAVRAPAPELITKTRLTQAAGLVLVGSGGVIILLALFSIRGRAAAPSVRDQLVRTGLYGHVRHPIHTGTFLEFSGVYLLRPTPATAVACMVGIIWLAVQTMLEEHDLRERRPDYRDYMNRVPRFFPRLLTKKK